MDEDLELNRLVKASLEAKAPFAFKCGCVGPAVRGRPRRFLPWLSATLLAASVAVVAAFHVPGRGESPSVEEALLLLTEAENVTLAENGAESSVDLLLAWQEAAIPD